MGKRKSSRYILFSGLGEWQQEQLINSSDLQSGDEYGYDVAISGDGTRAIVGAWREDTGGIDNGSAYIFVRNGSTWTQEQKIQGNNPGADDYFGFSVDINEDGTRAIVGAYSDNFGSEKAGVAYIFVRSGTTWTREQRIQHSDQQALDEFGHSVSMNDDATRVIVGAHQEDTGGADAGAAYIFTRSGTTWSQEQKIQASDKQGWDKFGTSVRISGDGTRAIVGAYTEDTGGSNAGAAYIFSRSGTTWTQEQKIQSDSPAASEWFGISIDIDTNGNRVTIGAGGSPFGHNAYVFSRSGTVWSQEQKISTNDGHSVSINGDGSVIALGNVFDNPNSIQSGSVNIYNRNGTSWTLDHTLAATDQASGDRFGHAVDITNNGKRFISGARLKYVNGTNDGSAYIFVYK